MKVTTRLVLAANGYDFRTWQPNDVIELLRHLDIAAYELPFDTKTASAREFGQLLVRAGVSISGIYTSSQYALAGENSEGAHQVANECLDLATELGCPTLLVYLGVDPRLALEQQIELAKRALQPVLERAATKGATVAVENLFDIKGNDPAGTGMLRTADSIDALFEAVPSENFALNFDVCNFYIAGLETPAILNAYERLRDRVRYVHLKDAVHAEKGDRERWPAGTNVHDDVGGDFEFAVIGAGQSGVKQIVDRLVRDRFAGTVVVEGMMQPLADVYRAGVSAVRSYVAAARGAD